MIRLPFILIALVVLSACSKTAGKPASEVDLIYPGLIIEGEKYSPPPAITEKVREIHSAIRYGEGVRGAMTLAEMNGEGNCGHYSILLSEALSDYSPRGYSLWDENGGIHRVVQLWLDGKKIVADATTGFIYPLSIEEIFADPNKLTSFKTGSLSPIALAYGPNFFKRLSAISSDEINFSDLSVLATKTGIAGNIQSWGFSDGSSGPVSGTFHWDQDYRFFSVRFKMDESIERQVDITLSYQSNSSTQTLQKTIWAYNGMAELIFPEPIYSDNISFTVSNLPNGLLMDAISVGDFVSSND